MKENLYDQLTITKCRDSKGYVFVSYSSGDKERVIREKIIPLQKRGLRVYCDFDFERQNESWVDQMDVNMEFCSAVLLFISREYLLSYATLLELLLALQGDKEIIPIYLEEKTQLIRYFQENLGSYSGEIVKMSSRTREKLELQVESIYGERYKELLRRARVQIKGKKKLMRHTLIKVFIDILTSGEFQDNRFNGRLDDLEKTIRDAASRMEPEIFREVFETESVCSRAETAVTAEESMTGKAGKEQSGQPEIYFFRKARMRCEADSFTILAGSLIRKEPTPFRSQNKKLMKIYHEAVRTGKLVSVSEKSDYMKTVSDLTGFESVSGAAKMVSGTSENGKLVWKDADGQSYGEVDRGGDIQTAAPPAAVSPEEIYRFQGARIAYDREKEEFTILAGSRIKAEPTPFRFRTAKLRETYEEAETGARIVRCANQPGYMEVKESIYGGGSPSAAAKMVSGGSVNGKTALIETRSKLSFGELHPEHR